MNPSCIEQAVGMWRESAVSREVFMGAPITGEEKRGSAATVTSVAAAG